MGSRRIRIPAPEAPHETRDPDSRGDDSRGSVLDEDALVAALTEGRLDGAGIDVFAHEPEVPKALWTMDNVVLMPRQASATIETRRAMVDLVLGNLAAHFAGRKLLSRSFDRRRHGCDIG